jgi:hypothetical protein
MATMVRLITAGSLMVVFTVIRAILKKMSGKAFGVFSNVACTFYSNIFKLHPEVESCYQVGRVFRLYPM